MIEEIHRLLESYKRLNKVNHKNVSLWVCKITHILTHVDFRSSNGIQAKLRDDLA